MSVDIESSVANWKGIVFAAFSSVETIAQALQCTKEDAEDLRIEAFNDFCYLRMQIECAKRKVP